MKNKQALRIEKSGNIFYKSIYNNGGYRIYRKNNKFKLFVYYRPISMWMCIGIFNNPRLVIKEIDYIASGRKAQEFRDWLKELKEDMKIRVIKEIAYNGCCYLRTLNTSFKDDFNGVDKKSVLKEVPRIGEEVEIIKIKKGESPKVLYRKKNDTVIINGEEAIFYAFWSEFKKSCELIDVSQTPVKKDTSRIGEVKSFKIINNSIYNLEFELDIEGVGKCILKKVFDWGGKTVAVNGLCIGRTKLKNTDEYVFEYAIEVIEDKKKRMSVEIRDGILAVKEIKEVIYEDIIRDIKRWEAREEYHRELTFSNSKQEEMYWVIRGKRTGIHIKIIRGRDTEKYIRENK